MLVQYYVLSALAKEFNSELRGLNISDVYTQHKNELIFTLTKGSPHTGSENELSLCISVSPGSNYIVLRNGVVRARKNSVSLFRVLSDSRLESITIHPSDRTLFLDVSGERKVIIQLYNTASSNIYLVDRTDRIIESFKRNRELGGTRLPAMERSSDENVYVSDSAFIENLRRCSDQKLSHALKALLPQFGQTYIHELLYRASIPVDWKITGGSGEQREGIIERRAESGVLWELSRELRAMTAELNNPLSFVYINENGTPQLSVIKLRMFEDREIKSYQTVNETVLEIIIGRFRSRKNENEKQMVLKKIGAEIGRTEKSLSAIRKQQPADPASYEYYGQLILANIAVISKGMKRAEVSDLNMQDRMVIIQLDPALTPAQNAEKYFQKARKGSKEHEETLHRKSQLEQKLSVLKEFEKSVLGTESAREMRMMLEENKEIQKMLNLDQKGKEKAPLPFRIFSLVQGYEVWVGKSSASNDLLTMKHSAPHDFWFHVRGASGSHTVLKVRRGETVPRDIVHQAASIAAYYSKMRNASAVPVAYCERKYVRKPKGVASGTVMMEREKVIFVKPQLPK